MDKKNKIKLAVSLGLLLVSIIVVVVCLVSWNRDRTGAAAEDAAVVEEVVTRDSEAGYTDPDVTYEEDSIDQVLAESKADSSAAAKKYTGTSMTFTAKVKATDDAVGYIDLTPTTGDYAGETIACNVADGTDTQLMKLVNARKVGDMVTVSGQFQTDDNDKLRFYIDTMKVS